METSSFGRLRRALAGRYDLLREVGSGRTATVYLADDLVRRRPVAVKVLRPDLAAFVGIKRFLREIEAAAKLNHPHIVPLYDSGQAGTSLYYVMPYVEGETLREVLDRKGALPVATAARILGDVVEALRYAHEQGVIHRDVRPENIMLSDRAATVMDFGVASALSEASGTEKKTTGGISLGTPSYMAPEQTVGDPAIDLRADLYSVGVVAYEMLTGRMPFGGASPQQLLEDETEESLVPVTALEPQVPPAFDDLVMKCLATSPADRWQTAEELQPTLEALAAPSGVALPLGIRRTSSRRARDWSLIGAVAIVLVVLGSAVLRWQGNTAVTYQAGPMRRITTDPGVETDPELSPDGSMVAYQVMVGNNSHIRVQQVEGDDAIDLTQGQVENALRPRWSPDGTEIAFWIPRSRSGPAAIGVVSASGGTPRRIIQHDSLDSHGHTWCPTGGCMAYVQGDDIVLYDIERRTSRRLVRDADPHSLAWSPDGAWIAYTSGNSAYLDVERNVAPCAIRLLPVAGGPIITVTDQEYLNTSPVWTPDGMSLMMVSNRDGATDVYQITLEDFTRPGTPSRLTTGLKVHTISLALATGRLAMSVTLERRNIWAFPYQASGTVTLSDIAPVTVGERMVEGFDLSPDGRSIVFDANRSGNQDVYRMTLRERTPERLTRHPSRDLRPSWSPDGRFIAFHSLREGNNELYVMSTDGGDVARLTSSLTDEQDPDWSPNGLSLVFGRVAADGVTSEGIFAISRQNGGWGDPLRLVEDGALARWSPDGRQVAYLIAEDGRRPSRVRVIDVTNRNTRTLVDGRLLGGQIRFLAWSTDGQEILLKAEEQNGADVFWTVPEQGGEPRQLARFVDSAIDRDEFATDGERVYFTRSERERDIHVLELTQR